MDTSKQVRDLFRNAGWYENRKVKVENPSRNLKSAHRNAIAVLEQYGGLKVGEVKAGRELSAGDISFMTNPYKFNQSYNKQWPNLNTTFFVFASAHNEHMLLMVCRLAP